MKNLLFVLLLFSPFASFAQWNSTNLFNLNNPILGVGSDSIVFTTSNWNNKLSIVAKHNAFNNNQSHVFETPYEFEMLFDFDFVNDSIGYACGGGWFTPHRNLILKTINAGQTWETLTKDSLGAAQFIFKKIDFINKDTGFVGTESNPEIFKTEDGGATWAAVSLINTYGRLSDMQFENNLGYVVIDFNAENKSKIFKSEDYGQNWHLIFETTDSNNISKISIGSNNTIYASGTKGLFLKSIDGGHNWQTQYIWPYNNLDAMHFSSEDIGYLNIGGTVHKTTVQATPSVRFCCV